MAEAVRCPKCGSVDLMYTGRKQLHICEDCSSEFTVEHKQAACRIYLCYDVNEYSVLTTHSRRENGPAQVRQAEG
jgi:transposase-like protein